MSKPKAIAVLSGGLDCCVATSFYKDDYDITAITFNYNQKSLNQEIDAAKRICEKFNMQHEIIDLPWLSKISNSSLTNNEDVPNVSMEDLEDNEKSLENAKSVWVPARNTVFCSIALSYAESINAEIIIVGWDYEESVTFPDNSKEYLESFNKTIEYGSFDDIEIKAPLIDMTKQEIVETGHKIDAPMELSYSCYNGTDKHCGLCESCKRRKRAFEIAKLDDPTEYIN